MSSVYEVKAHHPEHGHVVARIEADNERDARTIAKANIFIRKLSAREVHDLTVSGKAIQWKSQPVDAEMSPGNPLNPPSPDAE